MKIIINLPNSATALASCMLSGTMEQETIDAAIKRCNDSPVEIDMKDLENQSGADSSDLNMFNMALAIIAIAKKAEELNNENEQKKEE